MAQSAFAYQQPVRRERPQQLPQQPLRVLPGTRTVPDTQKGLAPIWRVLFATGIVVALFFGAVWWVRVALTDATMALLIKSEQTAQSIAELRSEGARLEVKYSVASSPHVIQEAAANRLGMVPDPQIDFLSIEE